MRRKQTGFWLFILPALFAFVLVVLVPAVKGFYYSFTDWNGIGKNAVFVGISNYGKLLSDSRFWNSFLFTFVFALCSVICRGLRTGSVGDQQDQRCQPGKNCVLYAKPDRRNFAWIYLAVHLRVYF